MSTSLQSSRPATSLSAVALLGLLLTACAPPALTRDGQLVFTPGGQRGASVMTANGVEFIDRSERPRPRRRRSAFEPWTPPTGFLLPADGVFREVSRPVMIQGRGVGVVLRASDALVPAWGGELLLRVDTIVPAAAFAGVADEPRAPVSWVLLIDGRSPELAPLAQQASEALGERDRVAVIDSAAGPTLPPLPGSHKSLVNGAVRRLLARKASRRNLAGALAAAQRLARRRPLRNAWQVLVLSDRADGLSAAEQATLRRLERAGLRVHQFHMQAGACGLASGSAGSERTGPCGELLGGLLPAAGETVLEDFQLSFSAAPAPARLLEASAGGIAFDLEADRWLLGDLRAGEARTEVVRVALPEWTAGQAQVLTVSASYRAAGSSRWHASKVRIRLSYSEDVELLGGRRHGDVIAYASALAMVRRLQRAFLGSEVDQLGGMRRLVAWQARSMHSLAKRNGDRSLLNQADALDALLEALDD